MTRKELLGSLMSKGVIITNPLFESEDLETIDDQIEEILESYCDCEEECGCPDCCVVPADEDDETEEVEDISVADQELIGKVEGETEVVHILYPGADHYPLLMEWAERIKEEYSGVDLKYFDDQDVFVFYSGDEDEALNIAEKIIDEIENEG